MAMNNRVLSIEIGNSFTKICEIDYKVKKPKVYKVLTVETPERTGHERYPHEESDLHHFFYQSGEP